MEKMQEEDFEKIVFEEKQENCSPHEIVKLYYNGTHSGYGCVKCGRCSLNLKDFEDR